MLWQIFSCLQVITFFLEHNNLRILVIRIPLQVVSVLGFPPTAKNLRSSKFSHNIRDAMGYGP